jgi:hypothetical protein
MRWARRRGPRSWQLPEDCRKAADEILISAARAGMDLRDLAALAPGAAPPAGPLTSTYAPPVPR